MYVSSWRLLDYKVFRMSKMASRIPPFLKMRVRLQLYLIISSTEPTPAQFDVRPQHQQQLSGQKGVRGNCNPSDYPPLYCLD